MSQLSFIYTLRSYHKIRHPISEGSNPKYFPYFPTDPEDTSPVSTSSPLHLLKSTFKFTRSEDSDHTLSQSDITLPKYNSVSTLAPSTSCTSHSRSHSTPSPKDISLLKISPPMSRRTSIQVTDHDASRSETPSHTQPVNAVTEPSSVPHMLRRTSRISVAKVTSDTTLPNISSYPEKFDGQTTTRDPSEIQSCAYWRPGHRGTGVHSDTRRTTLAWDNASVRHASQASVGSASFSSTRDGDETINEKDKADEDLVYSYGYGACGPTYPYLDMYNPQRPRRYAETSSYGDINEHGIPQGHRPMRAIPVGLVFPDVSSEPSSLTREEGESSSGEEEEYVAMMGGFVRRMATIESLGSKEAASTLSTTTSSAARHSSMRCKTPASQFSSVRFAEYGSSSCMSSLAPPLSGQGSLSTAYLSFSSGGTGMRVNERGELLPSPSANRSTAGSPCDRKYYTASSSSFPRMDDEDR